MSATEAAANANNPAKPGLTRDDVRDLFQEFTNKRGVSANEGGNQLMSDNAELRADKRTLKEKVERLEAMVPPEGSVVLKGTDVKLFTDLKALLKEGQKVEDLDKALKEHPDLVKKVADLEKGQLAVQIAEAEGWKVSALLKLTQGMDLVLEEVDVEVDDEENEGKKKTVKQPRGFIQVKDASGTVTGKKALREELKDFLPSLAKEQGEGGSEEEQPSTDSGQGTKFVRQSQGNKASSKTASASQDFLSKRYPGLPGKDSTDKK